MRSILFILIVATLSGCSKFTGKYASSTNPNSFEFNRDSTFRNEYRLGHAVKYSKGVWARISNDTVILNSEIRTTNIPLKVIANQHSDGGIVKLSIDLKINNSVELSKYYCYIYLNDKVFQIKRCDSLSSIKLTNSIEKLFFVFTKGTGESFQDAFPVTTEKVNFSKPISSDLKIEISFDEGFFSYHPFNNEKIKVKKNRIQLFNAYLNKWQDIPKVSKKTNVFIHFNEE